MTPKSRYLDPILSGRNSSVLESCASNRVVYETEWKFGDTILVLNTMLVQNMAGGVHYIVLGMLSSYELF